MKFGLATIASTITYYYQNRKTFLRLKMRILYYINVQCSYIRIPSIHFHLILVCYTAAATKTKGTRLFLCNRFREIIKWIFYIVHSFEVPWYINVTDVNVYIFTRGWKSCMALQPGEHISISISESATQFRFNNPEHFIVSWIQMLPDQSFRSELLKYFFQCWGCDTCAIDCLLYYMFLTREKEEKGNLSIFRTAK